MEELQKELNSLRQDFAVHLSEDRANFDLIHSGIKEIKEMLKPVFETYSTVTRMGRWGMAALVVASIIVGIIVTILKLK